MKVYVIIGIVILIITISIIGFYIDVSYIINIFQNQKSSILDKHINEETFDIDTIISNQNRGQILDLTADDFKNANEEQQMTLDALLDTCYTIEIFLV